ncbi:MAG: hypothetical protein AAGC93_01695 [Cyanobacteria bacterium P01_F01_bin.53]
MGLSKPCAEQRKKEFRIFRRIIIGAFIGAVGLHISSVPLIVRFAASLVRTFDPLLDQAQEPIDIIWVEEEEVLPDPPEEVAPPPTNEEAVANEPAAAAAESSLPPLPTSEPVVPTPPTANSVDTIPTQSAAVTSENGVLDGEGAIGDSIAIGIVPGSGSPEIYQGPVKPPNIRTGLLEAVPAIVSINNPERQQRRGGSRTISCDPCTLPDYPESQRRRGREGFPVIGVRFDGDGNVIAAEIESFGDSEAFDQVVLEEALTNWRFDDPYGLGGQVSVDVAFVMEGSEQHEALQEEGVRESVELPVQQSSTSTGSSGSPQVTRPSSGISSTATSPVAPADPPPAAVTTPSPSTAETSSNSESIAAESNPTPAAVAATTQIAPLPNSSAEPGGASVSPSPAPKPQTAALPVTAKPTPSRVTPGAALRTPVPQSAPPVPVPERVQSSSVGDTTDDD